MLESFLPERCRSKTFELDYCLGYVTSALVVQVAVGGSGAAAKVGLLNKLDSVVPESVVRRVDQAAGVCRSFGAETPVLMADGSLKAISEVVVGM